MAALIAAVLLMFATPAKAQVGPCSTVEASPNLPPADSPPLMRCYQLVFHPDGLQSIDSATYLYYIALQPTLRSQGKWVPYRKDDVLRAFSRLWKTAFLDDLWVEVIDEPYENGVMGKHVIFHMEERPRLKAIEFTGSKEVEISKIEEVLRNHGIDVTASGFRPADYYSLIRKVQSIVRDLYAERGYPNATVDVQKARIPGTSAPWLLRLTFDIKAGARTPGTAEPQGTGSV